MNQLGNLLFTNYNSPMINMENKKFGKWTVINFSHRKDTQTLHYQYWNCVCVCGTRRTVEGTSLRKGNSVSCGCIKKETSLKGADHYMWKGDNIKYHAVHAWLRKHYGKEGPCENPSCLGKSKRFEWALLKGKNHERRRENYIKLCHSCHFLYDMNEQWRKNTGIGVRRYHLNKTI